MGDVIVEEKVDGSQFRFGINEDGELVFASHHEQIFPESCPKMFRAAVEYVTSIRDRLGTAERYWYCEYLAKPHHNTLNYANVPTNHLVLFGMVDAKEHWEKRPTLYAWADILGIDLVPLLYEGTIDIDSLKALITTPSYLGNETVEGVVIKNYGEQIEVGGRIIPVFAKFVRTEFKERHDKSWRANSGKSQLQTYIDGFRTEARWHKAVQHHRENGLLENDPRDIGPMIKWLADDIIAEESENIKEQLYKLHIKDILRASRRGFPEWYKEQLLGNVEETP